MSVSQNLCSLVITYHRLPGLIEVLKSLLAQELGPDRILVFDNGREDAVWRAVRELGDSRLVYHRPEANLGPAGAIRRGFQELGQLGFAYYHYTGDDDPLHDPSLLRERVRILHERRSDGVAAVGSNGCRWNWRWGTSVRLPDGDLQGLVSVDYLGGGANCVFTPAGVDPAVLPTEALFFGFDDLEHCLKIRQQGLPLLADGDAMLAVRKRAGILGLRSYRGRSSWRPESLWRTYYSVRNYIYLMTRVFGKPRLAYLEVARVFGRLLYYSKNGFRYTVASARYQLRGIADGFAGRMGQRVLPELVDGVYPRQGTLRSAS